jgi:L,D-transpeptidase ErfK/SrfK
MMSQLSQRKGRSPAAARRRSCGHLAAIGLITALTAVPAAAAEYELAPGQKAVGELRRYVIRQGDVFPDIARHFDVGYTELVAANPGIDPWSPGVGREIVVPSLHILPDAPRQGLVINLAQWRLFYFSPGGDRVGTYPLGLGVIGRTTPLGATRIVSKEANPTWYPPPSIRAERPELPAMVPPGPTNPLGAYALRLGWPSYGIHGTNKPDAVGRNVSHGCIRLYPEDIQWLFDAVAVGTPVRTVDQPATAGWQGDRLYVQVYPSKAQTEEIDVGHPVPADPAQGVDALVNAAAGQYAELVDWGVVRRAARERTGMSVLVADRSAVARSSAPADDRRAAKPHDDAGPAQHYYAREVSQSAYTAPTPSPYPPYPNYGGGAPYYGSGAPYYGRGAPYYGSGAPQLFYDRATGQYYSPGAARQRGLYYDREAERWDDAPPIEAGAAGGTRVGPYPWGSPR